MFLIVSAQACLFKRSKNLDRRVFILNNSELLKLPYYRIRQTIAQSMRLDELTSGKPKKIS